MVNGSTASPINPDTPPSMDGGATDNAMPAASDDQPYAMTDHTEQAHSTDDNPAPEVDPATNLRRSDCIQRKAVSNQGTSLLRKAGICFLMTCGSLLCTTAHHTCPKLISEQEVNAVFPLPVINDNSTLRTAPIKHEEQFHAYHSYCQ